MLNREALEVPPPPQSRCIATVFKNVIYFFNRNCYTSDMTHHYKYKKAFTLAEVLITLGIIGVVVALTIPTLISKYQEKVTITKLKKVYSILQTAYTAAEAEYGKPRYWTETTDETVENSITAWNTLTQYITNKKDCSTRNSNCFASQYYDLNGEKVYAEALNWQNHNKILLPDGIAIYATINWLSWPSSLNGYWPVGQIIVDVNGPKGPNVAGKDYFRFYLTTERGVVPCGAQVYPEDNTWGVGMHSGDDSCFTGWVLQNENMNYTKCKDSSQFTWSHPSCD